MPYISPDQYNNLSIDNIRTLYPGFDALRNSIVDLSKNSDPGYDWVRQGISDATYDQGLDPMSLGGVALGIPTAAAGTYAATGVADATRAWRQRNLPFLYKEAPKNLSRGKSILRMVGRAPGWLGKAIALPAAAVMGGYGLYDTLTGAEDKGIDQFTKDIVKNTGGIKVNPVQNFIKTLQANPYATNAITGGLGGLALGSLIAPVLGGGRSTGALIGGLGGAALGTYFGKDKPILNALLNSISSFAASKMNNKSIG